MKKHEEIFQEFTQQMKHELEVNNHKGDWIPWKDRDEIISEIDYHVEKLKKAVLSQDDNLIKEHSADVANISMFMYNTTI
ncbi:hypothetical protein [Chryseobacterium sp. M5A1_1a]